MKRIITWLLGVLGLLAGLLLIGGLTVTALWMSGAVETLLNRADVGVRVTGLGGNGLRSVSATKLEVYDPQGTWLVVQEGRVVWHPLAYFTGTPLLESVEVGRVEVLRRPAYAARDEALEETTGRGLNVLALVPGSLRVSEVALAEPVIGRAQRVTLRAGREGAGYVAEVATLNGPETRVVADLSAFSLDNVEGVLTLTEAPDGLLARLGGVAAGGISATVAGHYAPTTWRVERLEATVGESYVSASGVVTDGREVAGQAAVRLVNMQDWPVLAAQQLAGSVSASAVVSGTLQALDVAVKAQSDEMRYATLQLGRLTANVAGRADVISPTFAGTARADGRLNGQFDGAVSGSLAGTVGAGTAGVSVTVVDGKNRFTGEGAGWWRDDAVGLETLQVRGPGVRLDGQGEVALDTLLAKADLAVKIADMRPLGRMAGVEVQGTAVANVRLAAVQGRQEGQADIRALQVIYDPYTVRLRAPTQVVWAKNKGRIAPTVVEVAGGVVRVSGTLDAQRIAGGFDAQGLDMALLSGDAVSGTLSGRGRIVGAVEAPVVTLQATAGVEMAEYPLDVTLRGDWRNGLLKAAIEADTTAQGQRFAVAGNVSVAGGLSVWPFAVGIGPQSRISGALQGGLPLATFNPLLWEQGLQVKGNVSASMSLGGTLGQPQPQGRLEVRGGELNHAASGMCLRDLRADIVGDLQGLQLTGLHAPDGRGGELSGEGRLGLGGAQVVDVVLRARDFRLFCGGLASGKLEGGLNVQGTLPRHTVTGKLTVGPLQVQLPGNSREEDIPYVDVVRVRDGAVGAGAGSVTRLNVEIDAPQQVYVRGRGLDAEFGGNINVTGTAAQPLLHGRLTALRGSFTLIDRQLQLAESALRFEGAVPPSPFLDVKATTTVRGTDLTLGITGQAARPKLALSSDPYVPQDEALALLLFGRSLNKISAFEALKLAQAARVLSGRDSGAPNLFDRARDTLGVDTLDVGSGKEGGVTVKTGKYLTDNVYLSVSQGAEPESREIKTEIELTPRINANTTVDGVGTQTFGVEWKRDY